MQMGFPLQAFVSHSHLFLEYLPYELCAPSFENNVNRTVGIIHHEIWSNYKKHNNLKSDIFQKINSLSSDDDKYVL